LPGFHRKCKSCSTDFYINDDNKKWFLDNGLQIPVRCEQCRKKAKLTATAKQLQTTPRPRLPFVPDRTPPVLRKTDTVRQRIPTFDHHNFPELNTVINKTKQKNHASSSLPTSKQPSTCSHQPDHEPERPTGSFWDSSSQASTQSSQSTIKKGDYWFLGSSTECYDSPKDQEAFWTKGVTDDNDQDDRPQSEQASEAEPPDQDASQAEFLEGGTDTHNQDDTIQSEHASVDFNNQDTESSEDMPDLQSSSSDDIDKEPLYIPSEKDFIFKDTLLRKTLLKCLHEAREHPTAFQEAWTWTCHATNCSTDHGPWGANTARQLLSSFRNRKSRYRDRDS